MKIIKEFNVNENIKTVWMITEIKRIKRCQKCFSLIKKNENVLEIAFIDKKKNKKNGKSNYYHLDCAKDKLKEMQS